MEAVLGETLVTVAEEKVSITDLKAQVVSSLSLSLHPSPGNSHTIIARTAAQQTLSFFKQVRPGGGGIWGGVGAQPVKTLSQILSVVIPNTCCPPDTPNDPKAAQKPSSGPTRPPCPPLAWGWGTTMGTKRPGRNSVEFPARSLWGWGWGEPGFLEVLPVRWPPASEPRSSSGCPLGLSSMPRPRERWGRG